MQRDVHFNIKLSGEETISLKPTLARELKKRTRQHNVSVGSLVNRMLEEKLEEAA